MSITHDIIDIISVTWFVIHAIIYWNNDIIFSQDNQLTLNFVTWGKKVYSSNRNQIVRIMQNYKMK